MQAKAFGDRALVVLIIIVKQPWVERVPILASLDVLEHDITKLVGEKPKDRVLCSLQKALKRPQS